MDKPASVRRVELRKKIIADLNAARLPPYVIDSILEKIIAETKGNVEMQYRRDLAEWEEEQKKEAEDVRDQE